MNKRPHKQYMHKTHPGVIEGESWCNEHPHTRLAETVLPLEPRFMFDAAGLATGAEVTVDAVAQEQADAALDAIQTEDITAPAVGQTDSEDLITALATNTPPGNTQEIIFVDSSINDYQTLLSGIDPNIEVVMLDAERDGVEQIAEILLGRSDISAIHIISHGDAGQLQLGNTTLTEDSMQGEHANELAIIGQALSSDADILIYGCNFAKGEVGQQAVETLAKLTGADIAASDDDTGATDLGGDWDLENQQGDIDTIVAISDTAQENWLGILDLPLTSGPVAGSYTVTENGQVTITITGADGGDADETGGEGATVTAVFNVSVGDVIDYVVGEVGGEPPGGGSDTSGGGGSTGVYINNQLVMVAGAGAGGDNSGGAVGLGGNDADLGTDGDAGVGTNSGAAGIVGIGGGGTAPAGGGGGGGGVLSAGGDSNGLGGAVSSAGLTITGIETADLVSGGTGEAGDGGDGGQGFTGGGGGAQSYAGAGGGYSGGGAAGDNGSAGGGGSFLDTTFTDATASFASGSSTPGGDGTGTLANGSIQITVVTGLTAVADTYGSGIVNEDAGLIVLSTGLLANDFDTRSIVAGATLDWNPTVDMDVLDDDGGAAGPDWLDSTGSALWELDANVTLNTSPTTNHTGITASYVFDGSGSSGAVFDFGPTGSEDSFTVITGDPSNASATFEIWFKDAGTATGEQIIFEAGGTGDGLSLKYNDTTHVLTLFTKDSSVTLTNTFDLDSIGLDASADFIQVAWTYDRNNPDPTDTVTLYVNGAQAGVAQTSATLNDWAGSNDAGLGRIDGNMNVTGGNPFAGEIAIFRFYESVLSLSEVQQNYSVVAGPQITLIDSTMSGATAVTPGSPATITTDSGGEVTVSSDGSISYNPNAITPGLFSSLNFGDTATDSFTYTISDGTVSDTVTVTITVDGNNEYKLSSLAGGGGTQGTIFNGIAVDDQAGYVVTSAGDINGDGFDDVVIGAITANANGIWSGESYVLFGKSGGFAATFELNTLAGGGGTDGFVLKGIDAGDFSARSISAGDVNGDGFSDLIIGAVRADPNGVSRAGETYVVFGQASFAGTFELSTLAGGDGSTGFVLNGIDADDISGRTVAFAGDVNGDGLGDIAIAAPWADPNSNSYSGETYLVYGRTDFSPILGGGGGEFELSTLAGGGGTNGTVFNGVAANDYSGSSVAGAGDIDGDGFDDLIIGAWFADPNGVSSGASYVVFGQSGGFGGSFELSSLNGTTGFVLNGEAAGDYSGGTVSSAGDINGDGFADVVVSASYADPNGTASGTTYVVYGTNGGFAASISLSSADVTINGAVAGDYSGSSATSAGDINGDGFDDLIIGRGVYGGIDAGASYVVFGSASLAATIELSTVIPSGGATVTTGFVLSGIDIDDYSGQSVSSAGDINGDGFDDLIIGAYRADTNANYAGEAYIIYGKDFRHESPIVGTSGADVLAGGDGNDALNSGAGDDTLIFDVNDTRRVDGGGGTDTLSVIGTGILLDLTTISNTVYQGIEIIDLTGSGDNTLKLSTLDLFDLSGSTNILTVNGNAGDSVILDDFGSWSLSVDGSYNVYTNGEAIIRILNAITVSAAEPIESELPLEEQELIAGAEPGINDVPGEDENTSEQEELVALGVHDRFDIEEISVTQNNETLAKVNNSYDASLSGLTPFSQQLKAVANTFNAEVSALMSALTS